MMMFKQYLNRLFKVWIVRGVALILFALTSASMSLAETCGPRNTLVEALASRFGESRHAMALNDNGTILEIFRSEQTGTWTIAVTRPDGISCIVASGVSFQQLDVVPVPEGDPA